MGKTRMGRWEVVEQVEKYAEYGGAVEEEKERNKIVSSLLDKPVQLVSTHSSGMVV